VSIYKSRTTLDHGLRRGFSTPCYTCIANEDVDPGAV
jgi:hypothetical protein